MPRGKYVVCGFLFIALIWFVVIIRPTFDALADWGVKTLITLRKVP